MVESFFQFDTVKMGGFLGHIYQAKQFMQVINQYFKRKLRNFYTYIYLIIFKVSIQDFSGVNTGL